MILFEAVLDIVGVEIVITFGRRDSHDKVRQNELFGRGLDHLLRIHGERGAELWQESGRLDLYIEERGQGVGPQTRGKIVGQRAAQLLSDASSGPVRIVNCRPRAQNRPAYRD